MSAERCRLKRSAHICELSNELEECIPDSYDMEQKIDDIAFAEVINSFLAELDREKRNIFVRRYWYLDSIADISKRFGVSESNVKTTLYRCRNQLRNFLEKEGYAI